MTSSKVDPRPEKVKPDIETMCLTFQVHNSRFEFVLLVDQITDIGNKMIV